MTRIRTFLIGVLITMSIFSSAQTEWFHISDPGINLLIADEDNSYQYYNEWVGSHGSRYNLLKSTDGSYSFSLIKTKTGDMGCYSMDELFLMDAETIFYSENCQGMTTIYKSNDGGENWINTGYGGTYGMCLFFLRDDFGYYSFHPPGTYNQSYLMRNGTQVFVTSKYVFSNGYPNTGQKTEIYFKDDSTGLIMCRDSMDNSVIIETNNNGYAWVEQITVGGAYFNDMHFVNDSLGFVIGTYGFIMKTSNFGSQWHTIPVNTSEDLMSIDFSEDGVGFITGDNGIVLTSTDLGETWTETLSPNANKLIYTRAFKHDMVYVLDDDGQLFCNQSSAAVVDRTSPSVKAFPNPVANKLILAIDDNTILEGIIIYDLRGRVLLQTDKTEIDLSHFEIGVYVLQAKTSNGVVTKRIIKK